MGTVRCKGHFWLSVELPEDWQCYSVVLPNKTSVQQHLSHCQSNGLCWPLGAGSMRAWEHHQLTEE